MNIKKLAVFLYTTCLGSLYGDVYDVTDDIWFQAFLKEMTDQISISNDKSWEQLSQDQKIQRVVSLGKETYEEIISEYLDEVTKIAEKTKELIQSVQDVPQKNGKDWNNLVFTVYQNLFLLTSRGYLKQLKDSPQCFETLVNIPSSSTKVIEDLQNRKTDVENIMKAKEGNLQQKLNVIKEYTGITIPRLGEILKDIDKSLINNSQFQEDFTASFVERLDEKAAKSSATINPNKCKKVECIFKKFVQSNYFPILAKLRTGKTQQPGCAAFSSQKGIYKFYVATKKCLYPRTNNASE